MLSKQSPSYVFYKLKYITLDCMSSVSKVVEQQVVIIDPDPGYRVCAQLCISYVCRCVEK